MNKNTPQSGQQQAVYGLLAEFDAVGPLMHAAAKVRDAGFTRWDCHTPFPVHGLDDAMGVKPTRLPWIILGAGITGLSLALLLQWWTNAFDYPFHISGKPMFSLPANIPVMFELTVLFSAFTAFFGCLGLNKLPELFHPLFHSDKFRRATNDRFFISIEAADPLFDVVKTGGFLKGLHPLSLETVTYDASPEAARLPKGLVWTAVVLVFVSFLPLAFFARSREVTSEQPRVHVIPDDMDSQYKFKPMQVNAMFADGRAMRDYPEGTVAAEDLDPDSPMKTGREGDAWLTHLPAGLEASADFVARGQNRYTIYCAPCHGQSGYGDGMIAKRADALKEGTWVPPSSFHTDNVRVQPIGEIYKSITLGVRNMPPYGALMPDADRWAIAAYVKALQLSQKAPRSAVPADILPTLQ